LTPNDNEDQKTLPEEPEEVNTCPAIPLDPSAVIVFENVVTLENVIGPPTINDPDVFTIAELSLASGSVPVVMLVAFVDSVTALVYATPDLVSAYAAAFVYAVVALLVIRVATELPEMLRVAALTEVAVIADAFTTVELAVKLPLTVNPFFTTKLLFAIPVPYP